MRLSRIDAYRICRANGMPAQEALQFAREEMTRHQAIARKRDRENRRRDRIEARFERGDRVWVKRFEGTAREAWESGKVVQPTQHDWQLMAGCLAQFHVVRFDSDGDRACVTLERIHFWRPEPKAPEKRDDGELFQPTTPLSMEPLQPITANVPQEATNGGRAKIVSRWLLYTTSAALFVVGGLMQGASGAMISIFGPALAYWVCLRFAANRESA
jgi:hypothetical protein